MYASYTQVRRKDAGRGVVLKTEGKKRLPKRERAKNKISAGAKRHIGEGCVPRWRQVTGKLVGER